ncbi:TBC1 domain family member 5 [Hypsizygus marmoreus]|uniref:TBC1 domain family member 5 n=1 Tax=Hypsizygus marmoreus TaxID=39966 RepID=A0A369JJE7_HYPMA|nr:TBC1 domain family member 5 [Hypsizygus marmoreus]
MDESVLRPPEELIKKAYDHLLNSGTSLSKLRDASLADCLLSASESSTGVAGRSVAWKLFLTSEEPLQSSSQLRRKSLLPSLRSSRQRYAQQLSKHMRAPDGTYEDGFVLPGSLSLPESPSRGAGNLETNNPLSLHNENPWKEWFASVELRKTILQDVERTFPDIGFFREPEVQLQLTNILFLYSVKNPSIGYRQGMHEVLAPLYYAVDYDSLTQRESADGDSELRETCSRMWVAADAWALFDTVMNGLSKWYEWREPPPNSTLGGVSSPLARHVQLNIPDGQLGLRPYVAPIVEACNRIQSNMLRTTDPVLWKHMQSVGIEPQIYGIRWLRLLFTREFSMPDAMKLWDGLFACDPTFELAQWICVAMLIRIRNELIPADYSGQLTVLLRYPSPPQPSFKDGPHHTSLLLRQALALQMSPTPSTGASIVIENRNLLSIPVEVPTPPPAPAQRRAPGRSAVTLGRSTLPTSQAHARQASSPQMGLPEMIARGLLERGESLGINKTLMSAVSEIRRNIPDLAASLVRSPNASSSTFPLMDERPPEERPPWEPRSRFEMEREISQLRLTNKRVGESLGWIVDVLLQDEIEVEDPQRLRKQKREALESLSYVRDILLGNVTEIEETRLVGEEESLRRARDVNPSPPQDTVTVVAPPPPVPVVDSRPPRTNLRSHRSRSPPAHMSSSPPMPTPLSGAVSSNSNRLPPWSYTRSQFSATSSSLPAEALPRLPPPTSTGQRRPAGGISAGRKVNDQVPHSNGIQQDPLGVLR